MTLPDLSDKYPDQIQIGKLVLNSYGRKNSIAGEIYTVSCSDDNSIVKSVLSRDGKIRYWLLMLLEYLMPLWLEIK